ncbi:MAG: TlpA disulfide reductase family protein [Chitinophagaceae bacterium]
MKSCGFLLLLLPFLGAAQNKLNITGKVKGLREGALVVLTDVNKPGDTLARGVVKKGTFILNGSLKEPTLVSLRLDSARTVVTFLENAAVKISGTVTDVKNLKVKGSAAYKDFAEFQAVFNPLFERLVKANQQLQYEQTDSLLTASESIRDTIQQKIDVFINRHPASPVSAFVLLATMQLKQDDILLMESRLNRLKPAALQNMYGKYVQETVNEGKITAVGSVAMDFTQADTLGNPVSLSSFRGKYVLVDFWASWCGPCRQENPNVVSNYNKFREKNFTVLGVSLDRPGQKDKWLQAIHADNLAWTHVSDLQFWNNAVAQQYRIQSIPQNLLIDPAGKIVAKNLRGPALEAKLCEVLGCN